LDYLQLIQAYIFVSPIRRGFAPGFVNYKKGCTWLAAASDKVYQLLAHGRWFSSASSTTKTGHHDLAEILLKVALNTKNQIKKSINLWMVILISNLTLVVQCASAGERLDAYGTLCEVTASDCITCMPYICKYITCT
jgi:hypothetical protein